MTSLDTNWDPSGRWASPDLSAAIAQAGLLLPNEAEAIRLAGADDLDAAVSALVAAGPRVVVKLGERGALCADGSVRCRVSLPPVTPVDTTGAGDCFNAGLIAGLLDGLDLPQAAALGCAAGALSTAAPGGTASAPDMTAAAKLASTARHHLTPPPRDSHGSGPPRCDIVVTRDEHVPLPVSALTAPNAPIDRVTSTRGRRVGGRVDACAASGLQVQPLMQVGGTLGTGGGEAVHAGI